MMDRRAKQLLLYYENASRAEEIAALIRDEFPEVHVRLATSPDDAFAHVSEAEIVVGWATPPGLLEKAPRLRWYHKLGAGVDDLVLADQIPPHVTLTRTDGGVFAERMAEYTVAYMLAFLQNIPRILRQQRKRIWEPFVTSTLTEHTVGVAGVGDIGGAVARKAATLGARVVGWRRSPGDVDGIDRMYAGPEQLHAFLGAADFIVIVLPLTPATKGLFDESAFAAMREGAYLINIGRGPITVESALIDALRTGRLAGAALDVFDVEPLPEDHPLWTLDNVIVTPHMSGPSVASAVARPMLDNLNRYLRGEPLLKIVDPKRAY